ncbi:hypothetical protein NPIL_422521 [Nephila pilipes]|uniref:Uncharacterized protein n=1 Tax=Nephila pilipes TaxID=299642 RepID=A0A8X6Q7N8_NEPPI|nr:hypothetical protein NPIL_422521 [Nephila pilipes]
MVCQLSDYGFGYPGRYISERSTFNGEINDEPGFSNNGISPFRTNLGSIYSIMMIESAFGDIVENSYCRRAFDIAILTHHLK